MIIVPLFTKNNAAKTTMTPKTVKAPGNSSIPKIQPRIYETSGSYSKAFMQIIGEKYFIIIR